MTYRCQIIIYGRQPIDCIPMTDYPATRSTPKYWILEIQIYVHINKSDL
jgi:hypothetical protein